MSALTGDQAALLERIKAAGEVGYVIRPGELDDVLMLVAEIRDRKEPAVKTTLERVRQVIADNLFLDGDDRDSEIVETASLIDDLGCDSLDRVEITMALEEEFGIQLDDEAVERFRTVGDIVRAVEAETAVLA